MRDHLPSHANVYYLVPAAVPETSPPPSTSRALRKALVRAWWRLRITVGELGQVLRPGERGRFPVDVFLEAEVAPTRRRGAARPARVLDFETARLRLRPGR